MATEPTNVTFGRYSFDLELGRLTRGGRRIPLPDKNAKLLAYLIEKRGALAKRQDVLLHLWPDSVPHDAEQAINKAISQLRTVLGDDSGSPKYIETIHAGDTASVRPSTLSQANPNLAPSPTVLPASRCPGHTLILRMKLHHHSRLRLPPN